MIMAPVMMIPVPLAAVLICHLVATAEAVAEVVTRPGRYLRAAEISVPVRIGWHTIVQIVPRSFDSCMKSLPLDIVIFMWRLLPPQVEAHLSIRHWHRHRAYSHSHG
jgi:hypothetical protein